MTRSLTFSRASLDIPTRQSYTMAVVDCGESTTSAGILSVARNAGAALAPLFIGVVLAAPSSGLPFLLAGGLKVVYHLWIFVVLRKVNRRRRQTDRLCVIAA